MKAHSVHLVNFIYGQRCVAIDRSVKIYRKIYHSLWLISMPIK